MSVLLIGSSTRDDDDDSAGGILARAVAAERPRAGVSSRTATSAMPFGTLYDLATIGDAVVCRRIGPGGPAQPRAAVPAALRHGARLGASDPPAGAAAHGHRLRRDGRFRRRRHAQAGAYATGVLVLMTSAAFAVAIALPRQRRFFVPISLDLHLHDDRQRRRAAGGHPDRRAGSSLDHCRGVARLAGAALDRAPHRKRRATTPRRERFINDAAGKSRCASSPTGPTPARAEEYARKLRRGARVTSSAAGRARPVPGGAARRRVRFLDVLDVDGVEVGGYRILRCTSPRFPNAIAGLLLDLRDRTGAIPHAYFGWTEGNPDHLPAASSSPSARATPRPSAAKSCARPSPTRSGALAFTSGKSAQPFVISRISPTWLGARDPALDEFEENDRLRLVDLEELGGVDGHADEDQSRIVKVRPCRESPSSAKNIFQSGA